MSHASSGTSTTGNGRSDDPILSTDGSVVVFTSRATNLLPDPVGGGVQLFLYDRRNRRATLISHAATSPSSGVLGGILGGGHHSVSGDGRWVAFASKADDLIAGQVEANAGGDVFLFDRATGANTLVSHAGFSSTQTGNGPSTAPAISGDGRYIAFESSASDLAAGQTGAGSIFVYDRVAGITTRVSASGGNPLAISADGRLIVFASGATNVVPGQVDTNAASDVFLWDRAAGTTTLVSHTPAAPTTTGNAASSLDSLSPVASVISADGRWITFYSEATDLVVGQTGNRAVFLFDRFSGAVTLVNGSAATETVFHNGYQPVISADGRFVAFARTPGSTGCFLHDRITGTTSLVSHLPSSEVLGGACSGPRLSADGSSVGFSSGASNLVADDLNEAEDAFLHVNPSPGRDFYTLPPCRLVDTRLGQGPALASGVKRAFLAHGVCGIPATARAIAANITVVQPAAGGYLAVQAGDAADLETSPLIFSAGQVRSNSAIVSLAYDGTGTLAVTPFLAGAGVVHVVVDVSGWFE